MLQIDARSLSAMKGTVSGTNASAVFGAGGVVGAGGGAAAIGTSAGACTRV